MMRCLAATAFETLPFREPGKVSNLPVQPGSPANRAIGGTGTTLAISYLRLGVAADLPRKPGRGGARNRADRESDALSEANVANLIAATAHADAIGLPFTRAICIHWESAGVPLSGMAKATGRFTALLAKFLARHRCGAAWLWTHENGERKGGHCHMLAHVPAALVSALTRLQLGWLRGISGKPYRKRVIHSEPIGGRLGLEKGNPELHFANLAVAFGYLCKAAPQSVLNAAGIRRQHEPGGRVIGKRCGTSQNIAAKARGEVIAHG